MKITVLNQEGNTLTYLIEREQGPYNNIVEPITLTNTEGLMENEIKTLGYIKLKPLAKRVFEVIEPLDEVDSPIDFEIVPSRTVKTEVFAPVSAIVGSEAYITKQYTDQYGQVTSENVAINTSTLGAVTVEGKTINIVNAPMPEPLEADRIAKLETENTQLFDTILWMMNN